MTGTSRSRPALLLIAATLLAACAVSIASPTARAGDFTVLLCGDAGGWTQLSLEGTSSLGWSLKNECDRDWAWMSVEGSGSLTGPAAWSFPLNRGILKRFRANVIGDPAATKIRYAVKLCGSSVAACNGPTLDFKPAPWPGAWGSVGIDSSDPLMPALLQDVRIEASCDEPVGETCDPPASIPCEDPEYPECPPTPEFGLTGVVADMTDATPPTVKAPLQSFNGDAQRGVWVGPGKSLALHSEDVGSGIHYLQLQNFVLLSTRYKYHETECGAPHISYFKRMCRLSRTERIKIQAGDGFWVQGRNLVTVRAYDMGGNPSQTYEIELQIDTVDPLAPENLSVSGSGPGSWITSNESRITWTEPTDIGSPITARVDIDPVARAAFDPPAIDLAASTSMDHAWTSSGRWRVSVRLQDAAGNTSAVSSREVDVDLVRPDQLDPVVPEWVGAEALGAPDTVRWAQPANHDSIPSGVCSHSMVVDQSSGKPTGDTRELQPADTSASLPSDLTEGQWYLHMRSLSCAGNVGSFASERFNVDLTKPTASDNRGGEYWLPLGEQLTLIGADNAGSGIDRVEYREGDVTGAAASSAVDLPLADGHHQLGYRAVDRAGNKSDWRSLNVGVDRSPPVARLRRADPATPRRVIADVSDVLSGIDRVALQYRSAAESDWRQLGEPVVTGQDGADATTVIADLPDRELPDGTYLLRVVATDRIGNRTIVDTHEDASVAQINLPARARPTLTFGVLQKGKCRRVGGRRKCADPVLLRHVVRSALKSVRVEGRLALGDGRPVAGRTVELIQKNHFSKRRLSVGAAVTRSDGSFAAVAPKGVSRTIVASFAGDDMNQPVDSQSLEVETPARLTFNVDRRTAHSGQAFTFTGKLYLGPATLTKLGKSVSIQYRSGASWLPLREVKADKRGVFRATYSMNPSRPLRLTLRAFVDPDEYWPFLEGASRQLSIVIRP